MSINDDEIIIGGDEVDEMESVVKASSSVEEMLENLPTIEENAEAVIDFSEPITLGGEAEEAFEKVSEAVEDVKEAFAEAAEIPEEEQSKKTIIRKAKEKSETGLPQPLIKPRNMAAVKAEKERAREAQNTGTSEDTEFRKEFLLTASPHIHYGENTRIIMQDVVIALVPTAIAAIAYYGWRAALTILVCIATSVISEYICRRIMKRRQTIGDYSAVVTGMLLAFCLPPEINPLFAAVGAIVAIVVVKQMFGGIGMNFANPAVTARIVLMLSFPVAMATWSRPFYYLGSFYDSVSSPTPLAALNEGADLPVIRELLFGFHEGCLGETCAITLMLGGAYLLLRGIISWHIPVGFIGTVAIFSLCVGLDPLYQILSGGVMLGAIFMATDYVTSPSNKWGKLIFGIGCGLITMLIRVFGSMVEGVSFAILLMNILTPHIERLTTPKPYGEERKAL